MSQLPITPLSPEEQQHIMHQMFVLMGKQAQSYHKHRHMGINSSIPIDLAQELMESVEYTVNQAGGICAHPNAEEAHRLGQEILTGKLRKARSMLELVIATSPQWQTECRWDAIRYLQHYLDCYDPLHLAHKGPEDLFYPILISPPEGIQGIDSGLFYLHILWIENQIMAGLPEEVLESFWAHLPAATLNQCEHVLINGIGKALLGTGLDSLTFTPEERMQIMVAMLHATEDSLKAAAKQFCQWIRLEDENAGRYAEAVIPLLAMWIGGNMQNGAPDNLFL